VPQDFILRQSCGKVKLSTKHDRFNFGKCNKTIQIEGSNSYVLR